MTIDKIDVNVCSPGRNFVTLKIVTSDGVVGWGDATLNGRELSVAAYLSEHLASTLIGRDEDRIEDTWQYLYRGAYWRRGPVTMAAIAAVDMALWDIKAKKAGVPLYQLLGGASRDRIGCTVTPPAPTTPHSTTPSAATSRPATPRCEYRPACPDSDRSTVSPPTNPALATTTNPPTARPTAVRPPPRSKRSGTPGPTCRTCRGSSRGSAKTSEQTCASCTTGTTG